MIAAALESRAGRESARLLVIDSTTRTFSDSRIADLPALLQSGDLLVVNDAATLPASLRARSPAGEPVEIRLARRVETSVWQAVVFGQGDWRIPTEYRDPPPKLLAGDTLEIGDGFAAEVIEVSPASDRLVTLNFNATGPRFWSCIYAYGKPVQYSYHSDDLPLWSVQTAYAARPWAMEMPSAGQPLTWRILGELRQAGVRLALITHAAGLSATGDADLDRRLPLPERYDVPQSTVDEVTSARTAGCRVVAVGTTVVRALEGCAENNGGILRAGAGETGLVIDRPFRPRIVTGLLTGIHDPAGSHFRLLRPFLDETTLRRALRHAEEVKYEKHEYGDLCLIV